MAAKTALSAALNKKNYAMLADKENITVIDGFGRFKDAKTIVVNGEELTADNIVINTGATERPASFSVKGSRLYTSTTLLNLTELPKKLVVLGCGYIALEFASMFANFGSEVSVIARGKDFLPNLDDDIRQSVKNALSAQGIEIILGAKIESLNDTELSIVPNPAISRVGGDICGCSTDGGECEELLKEPKIISADAFLAAFGRSPATSDLGLESAGIKTGANGEIIVDEHLRTSADGVFAVGDCKGGPQFTFISLDDYRIVYDALFSSGARTLNNRSKWASVTFMDTELAVIGKSERELKERINDGSVKVGKVLLNSVPMAKVLGHDTGMMKALCDAKTGEILGVALHCKNAGELINTFAVAMSGGINAAAFKGQIFTHPSLSEAFNDLFAGF